MGFSKRLQHRSVPSKSDKHLRLMVLAHLIWLGVVCLLGSWWGRLVLIQARKIAELENHLGLALDQTQNHWHRTERMLFWESSTFFALLLGCSALLFWVYWRDVKRARGIQAFFASVTHELRTPLTSIRLQAESISETLSEGVEEKTLVQRLLEDTLRLETQVERTLELARVEGGGPVYSQPLQIKPWLDRFLKTWSSYYREQVEVKTDVEDVLIQADPTAMQMIFKNLLENSIRHSKQNKIKITISTLHQAQGIALRLKDNGQGFQGKKSQLGKIFQKGPSSQGTGVGLYLVRVLMKRMGGWVEFTSHSGFEVSLWFPEGRIHG